MAKTDDLDFAALAAGVVSAYVANNSAPMAELPAIFEAVHSGLLRIASGGGEASPGNAEPLVPAVSIRKSVTSDHLICLDDGRTFRSLKRHLRTLGMTPDQYRAKWNLPADYPMVAPNYTASRSALAKSFGFGQRRTKTES